MMGEKRWSLKNVGHARYSEFTQFVLIEYEWLGDRWIATGEEKKATTASLRETQPFYGQLPRQARRRKVMTIENFGKVKPLALAGMSDRGIARETGLSRGTVQRLRKIVARVA